MQVVVPAWSTLDASPTSSRASRRSASTSFHEVGAESRGTSSLVSPILTKCSPSLGPCRTQPIRVIAASAHSVALQVHGPDALDSVCLLVARLMLTTASPAAALHVTTSHLVAARGASVHHLRFSVKDAELLHLLRQTHGLERVAALANLPARQLASGLPNRACCGPSEPERESPRRPLSLE